MRFAFVFISLFVLFASPVQAGEVYQCGVPETFEVSMEVEGFCDYYERRFAYREESIVFQAQLKERAEKYAAVRRGVHEKYAADLEALNERRGSDAE